MKVTGPVDGPGGGAGTVLGACVGVGTGLALGGEPLLLGLLTTLIVNFWPREQCDPKVQM